MTNPGSCSIFQTSLTANRLYSTRVPLLQCLYKLFAVFGGNGFGFTASTQLPAAGGDEPGAVGAEERGGAGHHLQAGDRAAQGVSIHDPQIGRRPRSGAADAVRRRGFEDVAGGGSFSKEAGGQQEDGVLAPRSTAFSVFRKLPGGSWAAPG